jgi:hypothetical protein
MPVNTSIDRADGFADWQTDEQSVQAFHEFIDRKQSPARKQPAPGSSKNDTRCEAGRSLGSRSACYVGRKQFRSARTLAVGLSGQTDEVVVQQTNTV